MGNVTEEGVGENGIPRSYVHIEINALHGPPEVGTPGVQVLESNSRVNHLIDVEDAYVTARAIQTLVSSSAHQPR